MTSVFSQLSLYVLYKFDYNILHTMLRCDPIFSHKCKSDNKFIKLITIKRNQEINKLTNLYSQGQYFDLPKDLQLTSSSIGYSFTRFFEEFPDSNIEYDTEVLYIEYIDRGINDWEDFTDWLLTKYPNVTVLIMAQNYSYFGREYENDKEYHHNEFTKFIQKTNLKLFVFNDFQSRFFRQQDFYEKWTKNLPKNSTHIFLTDCSLDPNSGPIQTNIKENSKLLIRSRI